MTPPPSRARRTSAGLCRAIAFWLLVELRTFIRPLGASAQATPVREADAPCARCHAEIYRSYLTTPMANAAALPPKILRAATFVHNPSGVEYKLAVIDGKASSPIGTQQSRHTWSSQPLSYFLGSGHLGITYLYSIDHYLFESPVAWYAHRTEATT